MELSERKYDLTEGVVWQRVLMFAMPILFGILLQSLYTTVDAIIIGRFAGKEALAAIESVYTLTKLPVNFFVGISSGATIIISQYFGAKKMEKLSNACHTAIIFALIGGFVLSIIAIFISPFFINLLKVPKGIYDDALIYVIIFFSGMAASMTYNIGAGIFRAVGNSKTPFYFLIIANIINIALDLLFIAVFDLGVVGAGLATVISQFLCAILVVISLIRTELPCKIYLRKIRLHKLHVEEFIKLGLPVGIQSTLYPISNMIIQTRINSFGINSIAAWAVCGKLDFLVWYISDAFCTTISTFVAQNYGAQKYDRATKGVRVGAIISLLLVSLVSCILYIWNVPLGRLLIEDSDVIAITSEIMHFLAPLYVLYVLGAVLPGAIRGTGESVKPMFITLFGSCFSRILWILFVVPFHPTLMMVLSCYPVSWAITSLLYLIFYSNVSVKPNPHFN
ncbi:MATE efflux family protein [Alkaliphilus metalliredigens QYMF]|uniref:MATE efflux family protein n=1 Tax=Alkaliphilus metalliredigens (strain QYMF) TaxID=293826 RepID=A6TPU9_ALKMQ|nr:MATE family efflux transporter [Alkaliphilus metalliredigens]ABR48217.1 MATE efflux family protein [Alkaliphilus metalliredigens QYMF]